jgi:hypothetical protein
LSVATAPVTAGSSLLGRIAAVAASRARAKGRRPRLAALVTDHLLTVAALGAGVADAFLHGGTAWGLGVLVPALLILDFKLQG